MSNEMPNAKTSAKKRPPQNAPRTAPRNAPPTTTPTPPRTKTREATKQETREALIRAGTTLFGEKGLDAPSLDEICEAAGFTRGAFYVHFRDRDDLLEAVMERVGSSFLDALLGKGDGDEDILPTVLRFVQSVQSGGYLLASQGGVRWHQLIDACVRSEAIRARYVALVEESLARLARLVLNGQRGKTLRGDIDAEPVATLLLAGVIGMQTMMELKVPFDLPSSTATLTSLLMRNEQRDEKRREKRDEKRDKRR